MTSDGCSAPVCAAAGAEPSETRRRVASAITIKISAVNSLHGSCLLLLPFGRVAKTRFRGRSPDYGRNADLLSAPSHPQGQWLFVADFVAVHSCEGSGGIAPLFPLTSGASWLSNSTVEGSEVEALRIYSENENALDLHAEDRGRPKIHCSLAQIRWLRLLKLDGAITLISALDATRPFPERKWSLPSNSRQGFLTSGSNASASRPSQSRK